MSVHLLIDRREKKKELRAVIEKYPKKVEWTTLQAGDYACSYACCGFERKEDDFTNMHMVLLQTTELKARYPNHYLVVNKTEEEFLDCGSRMYASRIAFLASLTARGVTVNWKPNYHYMLDWMYQVIQKNHDSKKRGDGEFNHVRHVKVKDIQRNILTSIPGIGRKKADMILHEFGSVANFFDAGDKEWQKIEGISIKTCDRIRDALHKEV